MQGIAALAVALLAASAAASKQGEAVSPIQKVIQMMEDMKAKAIKEKNNEVVMFTKFQEFCLFNNKEKTAAIEDGKALIEQLTADIKKYNSDSVVLAEEIEKLDASISAAEDDKAEAQAIRDKEHADFMKIHEEYTENIADLEGAIQKIKTMMSSVKSASASSLLQLAGETMSARTRDTIAAFLNVAQQPAAPVYESKAGGVVELMKNLKKKLIGEKDVVEKEEMKKQSSFDMIAQSLTGTIAEQTDSRDTKTSAKKTAEESSAKAEGDKGVAINTLDEDTKYLIELKKVCADKAKAFEERQKLRADELEALNQAIGIISSDTVSGASFAQTGKRVRTVLVQLRSSSSTAQRQPLQSRASDFLRVQGEKLNSRVLAALSVRVSEDPLAKVKKMIEDMVYKLMEEANEEAEHKGFCDAEMGQNKNTRDLKSSQVEELKASIEKNTAEVADLAEKSSDLASQVAELDAQVAKATGDREEEKAKNQATISDATAAKAAVEKALTILKEFYDKASGATSLVQTKGVADDMPETFDKPFTGTGGSGGIVGMLEVILSDFERTLEETTTDEAAAAKDYEDFSRESSKNKAVKNTEIKHMQSEKTRLESDIASSKKELIGTQEELDAALAYFEKLKPSCVDAGESYEERVAARKAEIESLQDAMKILEDSA